MAVARRIRLTTSSADDCSRALAVAARLWPDQRSDTAVFLRLKAAGSALRRRRAAEALRLMSRLPPGRTAAFLLANGPLWRRMSRLAIERRIHRGVEPAALAPPVSP